jgi:hypothetical protein
VELIVLHPNIIRWALSETLANLRADSRTAGIPIVIHSPGRIMPQMQSQAGRYTQISLATLSGNTRDFEGQIQPVLRMLRSPEMNPADRARQRAAAVQWLAHIAQGRRTKIFDISGAEESLGEALLDPQLAPAALEALSELASQEAQVRMAQLALDRQAAPELRSDAALTLAFHLQRFGLLLPRSTIDSLHKGWRSDDTPAAVRTALGSVIGSLEPDAALVGKRLRREVE